VSSAGTARAKYAASVTEISDDEFALFQSLICHESGIHLTPTKKPMLISRLMRRVNALKLASFGDYYRYVMQHRQEELVRLLDAVSTNETWFFRNPKHFSFVRDTLCPRWVKEGNEGLRPRRISAWSAAASSGEEPFSLAMALLDGLPGWDIRILASDLSSRVLERAELKNLHHAGHKEDETEDEAGEENRRGAIQIWFHFSKLTRPRLVPELSTPQKERVSTELYPQPALRLGAQLNSQHSTINSVKERGSHGALRSQLLLGLVSAQLC